MLALDQMTSIVAGIDVSRETMEKLQRFADLVLKWTTRINLIAASTKDSIWERHVVDSAQIFPFAPCPFDHWVDLGSGGGFPGVVVAIIGAEKTPSARFTMIESDQRKATFLRTAVRELDLDATVIAKRIDQVEQQHADVVSARALAALDVLFPLINRHLDPSGSAILLKGRQYKDEICEVEADWEFDLTQQSSMTNADSRILQIQRICRRE